MDAKQDVLKHQPVQHVSIVVRRGIMVLVDHHFLVWIAPAQVIARLVQRQ